MAHIHIIRKQSPNPSNGKVSKANKDEIRRRVGIISRVDRPAILDLFLGGETANDVGEFFSLEAYPASVVSNQDNLLLGDVESYVVPESDLGRKGKATHSQAESIRLWIKKHLAGVVNHDEVAVAYVAD